MNDSTTHKSAQNLPQDIDRLRKHPYLRRLLRRMPKDVAKSFTTEQLHYLKASLSTPAHHPPLIDGERSIKVLSKRYFFRLIAGTDRRQDKRNTNSLLSAITTGVVIFCSAFIALFIIYTIKSLMGINLFEYSLGIY